MTTLSGISQATQPTDPQQALVSIWPTGSCEDKRTGTGFFVSDKGHILTAAHVVGTFNAGDQVTVQWAPPGQAIRRFTAIVLGKKPERDVALLKVQEEGKPFPRLLLGNSDPDHLPLGSEVTIVGFPQPATLGCITPTLTRGQLTARRRIEGVDVEVLQLNVPPGIRPGSSGSPVLDTTGKVIGVLSSGVVELSVYFAIPIKAAADALGLHEILPPTFFGIANVAIEPASPFAGQETAIQITVHNTGWQAATKPVELWINGIRQQIQELSLGPWGRGMVSFRHAFPTPGQYAVEIKTPDDSRQKVVEVREFRVQVPRDFPTIQAAISASPAGGVIEIQPGTYSENLVIIKSLTLRGAGPGQTVIKGAEPGKPVILIAGRPAFEVIIKGLTVAGRVKAPETGEENDGVQVRDKAKVALQNIKISDNRSDGLEVWDEAIVTLTNSWISDNGDIGLSVLGNATVSLTDSQISGNRGGLHVSDSA